MILLLGLINFVIYFFILFCLYKSIIFVKKRYYKKCLNLVIGILIFCTVSISFLSFDIFNIKNDKEPVFSIKIGRLKDGGSTHYSGLGYSIWKVNSMWSEKKDNKEISGFLKGYKIEVAYIGIYEQSKFVPDK